MLRPGDSTAHQAKEASPEGLLARFLSRAQEELSLNLNTVVLNWLPLQLDSPRAKHTRVELWLPPRGWS